MASVGFIATCIFYDKHLCYGEMYVMAYMEIVGVRATHCILWSKSAFLVFGANS